MSEVGVSWLKEESPCEGCGKKVANEDLRGAYIPYAVIGQLCGDCLCYSGGRYSFSKEGIEGFGKALRKVVEEMNHIEAKP